MAHPEQLKLLATLYMQHTGVTRSALGKSIGVDQKFFFKLLDEGKGYHSDSGAKVAAWFYTNWPADLPWPWRAPPPLVHEDSAPLEPHPEGSCSTSA